jgi:mono/diheme cytochrome c family protein
LTRVASTPMGWALLSSIVLSLSAASTLALAAAGQVPPFKSDADVASFFATSCGFCHEDGGRKAARGPRLMGTKRTDDYIINRIATGKPGNMPAFGATLDFDQIEAIIHYIRNLKPD